jgi:hypothetical protein
LSIYGLSHLEKVLEVAVVHIMVEVDAARTVADSVVHEVVHVVMLEGVVVAYTVLQAVTSRNHDSVLFVVSPSIWLKNGTRTDNYDELRGN